MGEALLEMALARRSGLRRLVRRHGAGLEGRPAGAGGGARAARRRRRVRSGRAPRLGDGARAGAGVGAVGPAARGGGRLARRTSRHPPPARAANRRAVRHRPRSRGRARRRTAGRAGNGAGDLRQRRSPRIRSGWRRGRGSGASPARAATCWAKRGRWRGWAPWSAIRARRPRCSRRRPRAYERAGRVDDAITALAKCVELRPNDSTAYMRAYQLLRADLDAPGRALLFDALLSHRLAAAPLTPAARVALLFERGQHRVQKVADRPAAFADFKEILKIQPEHREALFQLARGASEDRDAEFGGPLAGAVPRRGVRRCARARGAPGSGDLLRGAQGSRPRHGDAAARGRPPARRSEAAPSPVGPVPAAGRVEGRGRGVARVGGAPSRQRRTGRPASANRIDPARSRARRAGRGGGVPACRRARSAGGGDARAGGAPRCRRRSARRAGHRRSRGGRRPARPRVGSARRAAARTSGRAARDGGTPWLRCADRRSGGGGRERAGSGEGRGDTGRARRPAAPDRAQGRARVLGGAGASGVGRVRGRAVAESRRSGDGAVPRAGRARQAASRSRPARSSGSPGSRPAPPRWASPGCTSSSRASRARRR